MSTNRPAFPESLPPKTTYMPQAPQKAAASGNKESLSTTTNIVLAFLVVAVLGNLGLTLYLNRSQETAAIIQADSKEAELITKVNLLQTQLSQVLANQGKNLNEIERLKKDSMVLKAAAAGQSTLVPSKPNGVKSTEYSPTGKAGEQNP